MNFFKEQQRKVSTACSIRRKIFLGNTPHRPEKKGFFPFDKLRVRMTGCARQIGLMGSFGFGLGFSAYFSFIFEHFQRTFE
jgi:hypothetical protein